MAYPTPNPAPRALVTGASSGIGMAIARELAHRGHGLILVARTTPVLEQLKQEIQATSPVEVEIRPCDLADPAARAALIEEISTLDLDILVNSAGVASFGQFIDLDPAYERAQIELNATAVFELTAAAVPSMAARRTGAIINVGSAAGNTAIPGNATYVGTKALVNTFTEALHYELKKVGVHCTLLAPGPVREENKSDEARTFVDRAVPDFLWTTYPDCAVETLDAAQANKLRIVPGVLSKIGDKLATYLPRRVMAPLLAKVYDRIAEGNDTK